MWDSTDCIDASEDLISLANIHQMCAGDDNGKGRDCDGHNASLDAIREMLVYDFPFDNLLYNPVHTLLYFLPEASLGRKMVIELLVFGVCRSQGWTKGWLEDWHAELEDYDDADFRFSVVMATGLATPEIIEGRPDPMVRCAYDDHSGGSTCEEGG